MVKKLKPRHHNVDNPAVCGQQWSQDVRVQIEILWKKNKIQVHVFRAYSCFFKRTSACVHSTIRVHRVPSPNYFCYYYITRA